MVFAPLKLNDRKGECAVGEIKPKTFLRTLKTLLIVMFSRDYSYVTDGEVYKGRCPACGFDHSQDNITRYMGMGGLCLVLGIFDTDISFSTSRCSNLKCQKEIKWYRHLGEDEHFLVK